MTRTDTATAIVQLEVSYYDEDLGRVYIQVEGKRTRTRFYHPSEERADGQYVHFTVRGRECWGMINDRRVLAPSVRHALRRGSVSVRRVA